ncbi:hypothetical protein [Pseudovibrio brasiliensis]|uniref:Uncharacterized protein n=1 Tax=Pseudovibrio brasiliensis TaxID=1898042 RepID=A0ABX8AJ11_9HYPH|nr:hypothetical protein [Pseudovibrio brasiliensis]QUS54553.1 hypothetical protein KGB56_14260 [Pseudovibrio brasiliensis]
MARSQRLDLLGYLLLLAQKEAEARSGKVLDGEEPAELSDTALETE